MCETDLSFVTRLCAGRVEEGEEGEEEEEGEGEEGEWWNGERVEGWMEKVCMCVWLCIQMCTYS